MMGLVSQVLGEWLLLLALPQNLGANCVAISQKNPTVAKIIETPGDDVISLRTLGKTNEIANKTPILYDVAKELCEFCLQQQKQK